MIKFSTSGRFGASGFSVIATAAAMSMFAMTASAQQQPSVAPAPAAKPLTPPPAPAATAKPVAASKAPVVICKGLDDTACNANPGCAYIVPKDANDKSGKVQKPYCRKLAGVAKQAADKKLAAPATATKPASPAVATTVKSPAPATKPAPVKSQ